MKKISTIIIGLAAITLITGCGNNDAKKTLVCTTSEEQNGLNIEQTISMTFENKKITHMKMDVNNKVLSDDVKENWQMFTELLDQQNKETNKDGVSLKVNKNDKNYEYRITLDIDLKKASKDALTEYGMADLINDKSKLEDAKKAAEDQNFTCKVQ